MADKSDQPSQDTNGVFFPTDYQLSVLTLVTSTGTVLDLKNIMVELDIYEDIFSPTMTGSITVADAGDIISNLKLHGNEYIVIEVDKPTLGHPLQKTFRIYKIGERSMGTASMQNYTLYFCSEELILSAQMLMNKSYKGLAINTMVDDILRNRLKVDDSKLKNGIFTPTTGSFDLIIPRLQPLRAIQWLVPRAYADNQNLFLFFENREGFNFTSYEQLISLPAYTTYTRSVKIKNAPEENLTSFDFLGIVQDFDVLKALRFGTYNSTLISLDLIARNYSSKTFGYGDLSSKALLNDHPPVNQMGNRLGFSLGGSAETMVKYIISTDTDPTMNPASIQNWMPQSSSRLGQIQTFKAVIHIPGDVLIKAGAVVKLAIPKMQVQENAAENDDLRSGRYLVSAVHHKFVMDSMTTVLELLSDSISAPLFASADNSALIQKVIKL